MTIIYGDTLKIISHLTGKIKENSIDHIITDPPFAINLEKNQPTYNRKKENVIGGYIEWDTIKYSNNMLFFLFASSIICKKTANIIIFTSWNNLPIFFEALNHKFIRTEYNYQGHIIWKYQFGMRNNKIITGHYHIHWLTLTRNKNKKEIVFNRDCRFPPTSKENKKLSYADRYSVWEIKKKYKKNQLKYTTELPSELCDKLIQYFTKEGDIVLDPFAGGGNIGASALKHNRIPLSIELNHKVIPYMINNIYKNKEKNILKDLSEKKIKKYLQKNPILFKHYIKNKEVIK